MSNFVNVLASFSEGNHAKGIAFEKLIKAWLQKDPFWKQQFVPESIKLWEESEHRWGRDAGIDLTAEDFSGKVWAIQTKNWNAETSLPKSEVDKFLSESNTSVIHQRLLVTTTNEISINARNAMDRQEKPVVVVLRSDLEESKVDWASIVDGKKASALPTKSLRKHQASAVEAVFKGLSTRDSGQLIMACGTGKTLTAQRIAEKLKSKNTLVLVPSILLVQQTLKDWLEDSVTPFKSLAVCSDESVGVYDQSLSKTNELPIPVTTSSDVINEFLDQYGNKVIFSTYQSSQRIADALKNRDFKFDLVLADEAHRLAGNVDLDFGAVLDRDLIPAKKRLFMTATPRIFTSAVKAQSKERGTQISSMDDVDKFGEVLFSYNFSNAIKDSVLSDYQVVIIGVTNSQIEEMVEEREFLQVSGKKFDARTLGAHIGLSKAMEKFDVSRVISFHSRVKAAEDFARDQIYIEKIASRSTHNDSSFIATSISGRSSARDRKEVLKKLANTKKPARMLVTNARCLTEGVDVANLDGVAFIDPRSSQVDIVQAVGRAIRKGDKNKKQGTIVIPLLLQSENVSAESISRSDYKSVWSVLNALRSHDERLVEQIDALRTGLGQTGSIKSEIPNVIFDFPLDVPHEFLENFKVELVRETSQSWFEHYGELLKFVDEFDHSRPPKSYETSGGISLGSWVLTQRARRDLLTHDQIELLEKSHRSWTWDAHESDFQNGLDHLKSYIKSGNKVMSLPQSYVSPDGFALGVWINGIRQSYKKGSLPEARIKSLEEIEGWAWDYLDATWNQMFEELVSFKSEKGNLQIPKGYLASNGLSLWTWSHSQRARFKKNQLSENRVSKLESLFPDWKWADDDKWELAFAKLQNFVSVYDSVTVPNDYLEPDGFLLRAWIQKQRSNYSKGKLSKEQISKLESVHSSWLWNPHTDRWYQNYEQLKTALSKQESEPTSSGPQSFESKALSGWVERQRGLYRKSELDPDLVRLMNEIPNFEWEPKADSWEKSFEAYLREVERRGTYRISQQYRDQDGLRVGQWLMQQRYFYKKGILSSEKVKLLEESHPDWTWDPYEKMWETQFENVRTHYLEHGEFPRTGTPATWIERQRRRYKEGKLTEEQIRRLEESFKQWSWDPRSENWNQAVSDLIEFISKYGNSRVAVGYRTKEGFPLGNWVKYQRFHYRKGTLDTAHKVSLEKVKGWSWNSDE
jgi:superfamily II DNA or RNA helicase